MVVSPGRRRNVCMGLHAEWFADIGQKSFPGVGTGKGDGGGGAGAGVGLPGFTPETIFMPGSFSTVARGTANFNAHRNVFNGA